jgi:NAD(P)-dependent dehydrogenase (short-subunit alcohol dehydrogenase family)
VELEGKVAIVTGAAAGTGRVIARRLADEGATVVVADLDPDAGAGVARAVRGHFMLTDVTAASDLGRVVAFAEELGGPHILVNNAGGGGHVEPHFPEATPAQWGATLDLNLRAPMRATQLVIEPMRERGGGVVVNIASTGGLGEAPHQSPEYAAAKAGLIRFTSAFARLDGVRVHCIVPDWILTERAERELAEMSPEERAAAPTPVAPESIADRVVELIRDDDLAGQVLVMRGVDPPP